LWFLVQTTPHRLLKGRPVGPRFVRFAALFYGSLTVAAVLWIGLGRLDPRFFGHSVALSVLLGALTAVVTVSLGLLAYRFLAVMRDIAEELAPRLVDGADRSSLVLVAVFSGIGEEVFFRGAIQQEFGLVVASLVFGLVHVGPERRYLAWTAWAILAGFLFGALYEVTGGLLAPILAHSAHNAATLLLWRRLRKGLGGV
jgi:membrane protease YdiL (CAAX protease family)